MFSKFHSVPLPHVFSFRTGPAARLTCLFAALILFLALACGRHSEPVPASPSPGPTPPGMTAPATPGMTAPMSPPGDVIAPNQAAADLHTLATELATRHHDLFFRLPRERWDRLVAEAGGGLASLSRAGLAVRFAKLVAAVGDGHTELGLDAIPEFGRLPLVFERFPDGLFITGIDDAHAAFRGKRVTHIGKLEVAAAVATVEPLISHDNAGSLSIRVGAFLAIPEVLSALGIIQTGGPARITTADGETLELSRVASWKEVRWAVPSGPVPLHLRKPQLAYWNDYLPEHRALYFKYNRCADDPAAGMTLAKLVEGTFAFMKQKPVERFVLDLRDNGGGDSRIAAPLIAALAADPGLNRRGRLFVLIGPRTFSSAVLNTLELRRRTRALLVGEPTGGRPSHHGEVKTFPLPQTGWSVRYSTKYFTTDLVQGDPDAIVPDLPVALTGADWVAGRDPVLDAALRHNP
ncbi:MAG: hypothetical protein CVU65_12030 [Deltaproteobacteria bacterium HGW-Deltaproteobacteria-22]|nr:MAG: hypothetical protein CVU65_12030 [Deltaproteobacteria bacterium HGW-Deltaproteobacteria-22]